MTLNNVYWGGHAVLLLCVCFFECTLLVLRYLISIYVHVYLYTCIKKIYRKMEKDVDILEHGKLI